MIRSDPSCLPPLLVVEDGSQLLLADGRHRLAAHERVGTSDVPVEVIRAPAGVDPTAHAFLASLDAAATGPLPPTMRERLRAAERLHELYAKMDIAAIARRCGLSREGLSRHLKRFAPRDRTLPVHARHEPDPLVAAQLLRNVDAAHRSDNVELVGPNVVLATVNQVKGLTFDFVWIVVPGRDRFPYGDPRAWDERCRWWVALTRARHLVRVLVASGVSVPYLP